MQAVIRRAPGQLALRFEDEPRLELPEHEARERVSDRNAREQRTPLHSPASMNARISASWSREKGAM